MREHLEIGSDETTDWSVSLAALRTLSEVTSPQEAYQWGIDVLEERIDADILQIATISNDILVPIAGTGEATGREHAIPIATTIPGSVVTSGEGCLIEDRQDVRGKVATAGGVDTAPGTQLDYRSLICAPIPGIGVVFAKARGPHEFTHRDLDLLERVGEVVGNIVDLMDGVVDAQTADPLLEEIGNMVSHDLRNKINIATGRLDLAIETEDNDHLEQSVTALESVERIADVVVSLARTGRPLNELEDVDLDEACHNSFQSLGGPNATLTVKASAAILADSDCLAQLLENLFRNCIEHSQGSVMIEVGLLEDGFYVADDGPGIPVDIRDDVKNLGYSTAAGHQGKGLTIVSRMAQAHGWSMEIDESTLGGTRVEIRGVVFR